MCIRDSVIIVHRHGAKAPPDGHLYPSNFTQKDQILSPLGQRQLTILGQEIRNRYVGTLLGKDYTNEELKTFSSDTERTYQSATGFLNGLYPPGSGQMIDQGFDIELANPPLKGAKTLNRKRKESTETTFAVDGGLPVFDIKISQSYKDLYFRAGSPVRCPPMRHLYEETKLTEEYKKADKEFREEIYPIFVNRTQGMKGSYALSSTKVDYRGSKFIWESYLNNIFHGIRVPAFTDEEEQKIADYDAYYQYAVRFATKNISRAVSSPIYTKIYRTIKDYVETVKTNHSKLDEHPKMVVFSGHRSTLLGMLTNILDKETTKEIFPKVPPFASILIFELIEEDNKEFSVRFTYNSNEIILPVCKGDPYCSVDKFLPYLKDQIFGNVPRFCDGIDKELTPLMD
eukprot:TRINITY_DN2402_c0_g1_i3.p1 TRINITY_DN2402_c0_g1~~TRINITY_DN2402_c0_g1_i3.p1  ORF type:complete len:400 (+),score=97.38 TRINITY_DN2402_c0_g1_i3:67-1266(+)